MYCNLYNTLYTTTAFASAPALYPAEGSGHSHSRGGLVWPRARVAWCTVREQRYRARKKDGRNIPAPRRDWLPGHVWPCVFACTSSLRGAGTCVVIEAGARGGGIVVVT